METIDVFYSLISAGFGVLLIVFWNAWRANRGKFSFNTWLVENGNPIAFTGAAIVLLVTISAIIPEVAETVKTVTGLDLPNTGNKQAWFTLGALIYKGAQMTKRKK